MAELLGVPASITNIDGDTIFITFSRGVDPSILRQERCDQCRLDGRCDRSKKSTRLDIRGYEVPEAKTLALCLQSIQG